MNSFSIDRSDGRWHVELNGVDITSMIADGGVKIVCRAWPLSPAVELLLMPDNFHAHLSEADVAVRSMEVEA
jgi:hypothetical protein